MPIWLTIVSIFITLMFTIFMLTMFYREWKWPKKNKYPNKSIRKFIKNNAVAIYLLVATVGALTLISFVTLAISG